MDVNRGSRDLRGQTVDNGQRERDPFKSLANRSSENITFFDKPFPML